MFSWKPLAGFFYSACLRSKLNRRKKHAVHSYLSQRERTVFFLGKWSDLHVFHKHHVFNLFDKECHQSNLIDGASFFLAKCISFCLGEAEVKIYKGSRQALLFLRSLARSRAVRFARPIRELACRLDNYLLW